MYVLPEHSFPAVVNKLLSDTVICVFGAVWSQSRCCSGHSVYFLTRVPRISCRPSSEWNVQVASIKQLGATGNGPFFFLIQFLQDAVFLCSCAL